MLEISSYLILNALRTYLLYRFVSLFFEEYQENKYVLFEYVVYFLINSVEYLCHNSDIINILISIGGLFLVIFTGYKGSFQRKVLSLIAVCGLALLTENVAWVIFVKDKDVQMAEIGFFFSVFIFFILEMLIEKTVMFRRGIELSFKKDLMLVLISAGSMFIANVMIEGTYNNNILLVGALCVLLFINIIIFYLYDKLMNDYVKEKEKEMYGLQLTMYRNQLKILQNANDTYKTLRHDMKHHIMLLSTYIEKDEKEKALEYIGKINSYSVAGKLYVDTGNECIDSILNYMMDAVGKIGGNLITDIRIPQSLPVNDYDINIILSNLLLNAYEAIQKSERKRIELTLQYDRGIMKVKIVNDYDGILRENDNVLLTTKEKQFEHGVGLLSVKRTVEKYGGKMLIDYTEDVFEVNLFIYLNI